MATGFKLPSRSPPTVSSSSPQLSSPTAQSAQSLINQLFAENEATRAENAQLKKQLDDLKAQAASIDALRQQNSQLSHDLEQAQSSINELQQEVQQQQEQVMQAQQAAQQAAAAAAAAAAAFSTPMLGRPSAASLSTAPNRPSVGGPSQPTSNGATGPKFPFKQGNSAVPPPMDNTPVKPAAAPADSSADAPVGMSRAAARRKSRAQVLAASDDLAGKDTVTALYDYKAMRPEEISFNEGDVFPVTEKDASGWWKGIIKGQEGLFPSNYTKPNA